eukprot:TRINITY_DN20247_c0_g1_i1.p1 TRINITY_DN20247_c0_g1~~TRINITY_DN20247_c0_g1_i1.p1  ORF type:complete len:1054 (-),score=224.58 TRINITY_DN20247_c0_g1_i1:123-3284(-)
MVDITEDEAVLHLKKALGELEPGDPVPAPLPVAPKPQPPAPKAAPAPATQPASFLGLPQGACGTPSLLRPPLGNLPAPAVQPPQPLAQHPQLPTPQALPPGQQPVRPPGLMPGAPPGATGPATSPAGLPGFGAPKAEPPQMPPGLTGHPMPTLPGMPPGGKAAPPLAARPPVAPGFPAPAAPAAPVPAAASKPQVQFEIPQAKVATVIGKGGAVLEAIKKYSKAECYIEQRTPDQEHARVTAVGSDKEVAKCKQTVKALVDGALSLATLGSLAGVKGLKEASATEDAPAAPPAPRPGLPGAPPLGALPPGFPAGGAAPPPALLAAMAAAGRPMGPGGLPLPLPPQLAGATAGGQVPGMPENQAMQANLNDYYARWWTSYALNADEEKEEKPKDQPLAFDKEALQRLADKAQSGEIEEPAPASAPAPLPPADAGPDKPSEPAGQEMSISSQLAMGQGSLEERSVAEVRAILGVDDASAVRSSASASPPADSTGGSAKPVPAAPATSNVTPGSLGGMSFGNTTRKMPELTLKGFLRPGGFDEEPQTKKDADSVQKMLERLQGNVSETKQAVALQAQLGGPARAGGLPKAAFPGIPEAGDDLRTQGDYQFEALMSRAQAATDQESLDNVAREILIRFPSFAPQHTADLVQKMDTAPGLRDHSGGDFLAELCRLLGSRLRELTSTQFTTICGTVAAWSADPKRRRAALFAQLSKGFFTSASNEMSSRLMTFAPHELNSCLAAFVSVGFAEHKFFASVGRAALARHTSFAPVQLTALLAILSEMRLVHTDLFNAAASFLASRTKELRPVDISRVLRSFAKCNVQHQELCATVSEEVVSRVKAGTAFKAEDLCEIVWALCVLEHFNADLLKVLFKALEKVPMISSDALTQLFECHLCLESEHKSAYSKFRKSLDPDTLDALQDHYRDSRKDERRCSEKHRNDVASVLKSLVEGSVHVNHRTSCGLLVDVAALRKRSSTDGFVHVDLDSNVTSVRSLDQDDPAAAGVVIEGAVAMRRRILQKQGLRLVTVRESEWRDFDETKEKRRHLRNLLSALGDVLE